MRKLDIFSLLVLVIHMLLLAFQYAGKTTIYTLV